MHAIDDGSPVEYLLSLLRTLPLRQPRLRDERWEEDRRARGNEGLHWGWVERSSEFRDESEGDLRDGESANRGKLGFSE